MSDDTIYVVALNRKRFEGWCGYHGISPASGSAKYVRNADDLRGLRNVNVLFLYGWGERSDWRTIYNAALIVQRRPS